MSCSIGPKRFWTRSNCFGHIWNILCPQNDFGFINDFSKYILPFDLWQVKNKLNCSKTIWTSAKLFWTYSWVQNKHSPTLINFLTLFQGLQPYSGLHRAYLSSVSIRYKCGYAYSFCQIFQGLRLFKGLRLFQTLE